MNCEGIRDLSLIGGGECKNALSQEEQRLCVVHIDYIEEAKNKYPKGAIICPLSDEQFTNYKDNGILPIVLTDIDGYTVSLVGLM